MPSYLDKIDILADKCVELEENSKKALATCQELKRSIIHHALQDMEKLELENMSPYRLRMFWAVVKMEVGIPSMSLFAMSKHPMLSRIAETTTQGALHRWLTAWEKNGLVESWRPDNSRYQIIFKAVDQAKE